MRKHEIRKSPVFTDDIVRLYPELFYLLTLPIVTLLLLLLTLFFLGILITMTLKHEYASMLLCFPFVVLFAYITHFISRICIQFICIVTILPDALVVVHPLLFRKRTLRSDEIYKQRMIHCYAGSFSSHSLLLQLHDGTYMEFLTDYLSGFDKLRKAIERGKIKRSEKIEARWSWWKRRYYEER